MIRLVTGLVLLVGLSTTIMYFSLTSKGGGGEVRPGEPVVYVGAVLEYEPFNQWAEGGGEAIIWENARTIAHYAFQAKIQGADILVAPEYGLQSLEMHINNEEEMFSLMQYVPDPKLEDIPCTMMVDPDHAEAVRTLSCAALENEIYLVVDVPEASPCRPDTAANSPFRNALDTAHECPSNGYIYYNTQVAFDRKGTVIARYRKKNLFLEPQFTPGTESDDTAIFTTDFGVTFTMQVCFDIAFQHPGLSNVENLGIKDVVMSTAWVDNMPFLAAPSVQNGFSRELGVNLLVAGYHLPERSKMGSGIFRGYSDLGHTYVYDSDSGSKMVVSKIETVALAKGWYQYSHTGSGTTLSKQEAKNLAIGNGSNERFSRPRRKHLLFYDDLSNYTQVLLAHDDSGGVQHAEACHQDGLCCSLFYMPTARLNYSLLAYSGPVVQGFGYFQIYSQVCAVVWCRTEDIDSCGRVGDGSPDGDEFGPFTISGNFSVDHVFPMLNMRNLSIVDNDHFSLAADGRIRTLRTQEPTSSLLTGGFYGRWYDRDPKPHFKLGKRQSEEVVSLWKHFAGVE